MSKQRSFRHLVPAQRIICGADSLASLEPELDRVGCRRAILICGATLSRDERARALVETALGGRLVEVFAGVRSHSPLPDVEAAAAAIKHAGADAVVAFGGGSAVVTARAATILAAEERPARDLCAQFVRGRPPISPKLPRAKLPQFVVATTPTTAYGKAGAAIFDPDQGRRLTLFDPKTRPQAVFIHPELTRTAPGDLVRGAALNAFVMAVQGLESQAREPLADASLFQAIRLIARRLPQLGGPDDDVAREELMLAAWLAGQGTDYTTGALASVIGHAIGARHHLDNGLLNAILSPHTLRFNQSATAGRLSELPALINEPTFEPIESVERFLARLPIPRRLRDLGVERASFPQILEDASLDWFLYQNPRKVDDVSELSSVLEAAW